MGAFNTQNAGPRIHCRARRTRPETTSLTSAPTTTEYVRSVPNATIPNTAKNIAGVDERNTNTARSSA